MAYAWNYGAKVLDSQSENMPASSMMDIFQAFLEEENINREDSRQKNVGI